MRLTKYTICVLILCTGEYVAMSLAIEQLTSWWDNKCSYAKIKKEKKNLSIENHGEHALILYSLSFLQAENIYSMMKALTINIILILMTAKIPNTPTQKEYNRLLTFMELFQMSGLALLSQLNQQQKQTMSSLRVAHLI